MTKIAILGPGAIGLCVAHGLIQSGHAPHLYGRRPLSAFSFAGKNSAPIYHNVTWHDASCPPAEADYEWLIICLKSHQTEAADDIIKALIGPNTRVAILQNGVGHVETLEKILDRPARLVPAIIDIPASRHEDMHVFWRGVATAYVPNGPDGAAFCDLFNGTFIQAEQTDDWLTRAWTKLCLNAPAGAVTALTRQPMGVFHRDGIADIARGILQECIAVGRAEGAHLPDDLEERQMQAFMSADPESGNSMYADAMSGIETEWRARNEVIAKKGRVHGIATPVSDLIVPLLAALR